MSLPLIAIVGQPNVGKSSLFNRFMKKRLAVVDSEPGVTRDRNYGVCDWNGIEFRLVDTGGLVPESKNQMEQLIYDQTAFAINEADLVLLVLDTQLGVDNVDKRIARDIQKAGLACILVANKVDSEKYDPDIYEFLNLGLGEPFPVSATVGRGIGELLDEIVARLPVRKDDEIIETGVIRVALVGRPNVGKSSYINKLLGEERLIVSPTAGTTRDSVDTPFEFNGRKYILIDTAGLRRKYKVVENIEFYTNLRAEKAIEDCDIVVLLIDAVDGVTAQDQRILSQVLEKRRAAVLAINKWDLIEKDGKTADEYSVVIKSRLAKFAYLPIIYISALTGQRIDKVMDLVNKVYENHHRRIATAPLNDFLAEVFARRKPPAKQRKYIQMKYITQTESAPPTFIIFTNHPRLVDKSYIHYLSNQLRARFDFEGVPIRIKFRQK
ncbi:MAG: ribosome biogenesis GTPase Der [candidate division Zixibacteria bacterium]|nr:ribosome biogenesis GTPase Der [candidate division Zixibacteria bacterium]